MNPMSQDGKRIVWALELLDGAAAEKRTELAGLLKNKYARLKALIIESGNGGDHAREQRKASSAEPAREAGTLDAEKAICLYQLFHRN